MTNPIPANVTVLDLASLALSAVFAPLVAWLTRSGAQLWREHNVVVSRCDALTKDVEKLQVTCESSDRRIIKLEEAFAEIKQANQRSESTLAAISIKLDALPRLDATIQAQATLISKVVPREEVERSFDLQNQRISLIEQDIRKQ